MQSLPPAITGLALSVSMMEWSVLGPEIRLSVLRLGIGKVVSYLLAAAHLIVRQLIVVPLLMLINANGIAVLGQIFAICALI
jgi:hypothetical protein